MTTRAPSHPIERVLRAINAATTHLRLYAEDHPVVAQSMETAFRELAHFVGDREETTLLRVDDQWVWKERPLAASGQRYGRLMKELEERGIESITFRRGVRRDEFHSFLKSMARGGGEGGGETISCGRLILRAEAPEPPPSPQAEDRFGQYLDVRRQKYDDLKAIAHQIRRQRKIDIRGVEDVVGAFIKGFAGGVSPIRLLLDLRSADEYTYTHMVNVCILTMSQAEALGFRGPRLYEIGVAAILHDAGKLFIPGEILNKPGRLTPEERTVIETHSARGANFILSQAAIPRLAVVAALEHHIRFDGTGYPNIGNGYRANIVSQMIAIADVFDAMRSRRPYKEPAPLEVIVRILNDGKGAGFNPTLVESFLRLIARAPGAPRSAGRSPDAAPAAARTPSHPGPV